MTDKKKLIIIWISAVIVLSAALIVFCISLTKKVEIPAVVSNAEKFENGVTPEIKEENENIQKDDKPEPEFIVFGDNLIEANPDVPKSFFDTNRFFTDQKGRMKYEGAETLCGIDVSEHREEIDWTTVKADGIDFAMIRIGWRGSTEGLLYKDERFDENITAAQISGIKVGVYFFSQAVNIKEAKEEAEIVISWLKSYSLDFPVAFDWELPGNDDARTLVVTSNEMGRIADTFCSRIKEAGYTPIIYMNKDLAYNEYNLSEIAGYDFWAAEYEENPEFYYEYTILQYSSEGSVKGIDGAVDMNISFRDYSING